MRIKASHVCAVVCLLALAAAGRAGAQEAAPKTAGPERVLVKIGDDTITQRYFDLIFDEMAPAGQSRWQGANGKREFLTEMITVRLLAKEARRLNLDKDPAAADRIKSAVEQTLAREYQRHLIASVQVTEEEAKAFWEQHKERFNVPEQVHAGHIVVKNEAEAKAAQAELAKGREFAEVAREASFGPEREKGGDLGWIPRGALIPPLDEALFKLADKGVSEPVKTDTGYHLLKLYERKPAVEKPYAEVQEEVRQFARADSAIKRFEEEKKRLSLEYNVEVVNDPVNMPPKKEILQQIKEGGKKEGEKAKQ